jgi:endonuclease-8
VPEGDTLFRTATVLREILAGKVVTAARGRPDGPALGRVVGSNVDRVAAQGKHLLIDFSAGLTLHTHLRMHGSWHRYRAGERWRRSPSRAVAVIEVRDAVAVCFDAPTVELLDTRAVALHPYLSALGPDMLGAAFDVDEAVRRLRDASRREHAIGDALLDQTAQAGLGNVYRSEVCWIERVDPFASVAVLDDATLRRLLVTGQRLIEANRNTPLRTTTPDALGGAPGAGGPHRGERLFVYGRSGRPCRRCAAPIRTRTGGPLARRTYWCPTCQPAVTVGAAGEERAATRGT